MRAITWTGYGRPSDVLRPDDVDDPTIDDDQVLVTVHAASLNPADWHLIRGVPYIARLQVGPRNPPHTAPGVPRTGGALARTPHRGDSPC